MRFHNTAATLPGVPHSRPERPCRPRPAARPSYSGTGPCGEFTGRIAEDGTPEFKAPTPPPVKSIAELQELIGRS